MTAAAIGALIRPDAMVTGGLVDDIDVTLSSVRFVLYDYDGKVAEAVLALHVKMTDDDGTEYDQYYSAGDSKFFVPSKDGSMAMPVGSRTALSSSSNAAQFLISLVNAGFPQEQMEADVTIFETMKVHVNRVAQPKRSGIIKNAGDNEREKTVLIVTRIIAMPGEEPVKKGGAKAGTTTKAAGSTKPAAGKAAATKAAAPAASDDDLSAALTEVVTTALAEAGGTVTKKDITGIVFRAMKDHPGRNQAVKLVHTDDFLSSGPWTYDGSELSL